MKTITKNWKTTVAGILIALLPVAVSLGWINGETATGIGSILVGLGFAASKDGNVTGGTTPQ